MRGQLAEATYPSPLGKPSGEAEAEKEENENEKEKEKEK